MSINRTRLLVTLLRVIGFAGLLALPCALMPGRWMETTHRILGLGDLPTGPIVGYLARSTSLFYSLVGGLMVLVSLDIDRYRPVIIFLGICTLILGSLLFGVDLIEGLPWWWTVGEGFGNAAIGAALLVLSLPRKH